MEVIVTEPEQLSDAVAVPVFDGAVEAEQLMVVFAGHVILGGVTSLTTTSWLHVALLPKLSVTVQTTVVEPTWNTCGALLVTVSVVPEQLDPVEGFGSVTEVAVQPELVLAFTVPAQLMVGTQWSPMAKSPIPVNCEPFELVDVGLVDPPAGADHDDPL